MKKLIVLTLMFAAIYLLLSCKKEYSYEGGPTATHNNDSALYTLTGFPNACSNSIVLGNYFTGTKLSASNTITLEVTVSKTGYYSIATNTSNGMQFTGSGRFTQTGSQKISLLGTGTPQFKGSSSLLVTEGNTFCSFTITVKEVTPVDFALDTWEFTQNKRTYRGYFDGALTNVVNGSTVLTLVGLTPTKDTAITLLVDIIGSLVVKTGSYKTLVSSTFSFFDNRGNSIYMADKTSPEVELVINIASFDQPTQIISGTFNGTARDANISPVPITEGRFRAKLNK